MEAESPVLFLHPQLDKGVTQDTILCLQGMAQGEDLAGIIDSEYIVHALASSTPAAIWIAPSTEVH